MFNQAKLDSIEVKDEEVQSQLDYRFESILRQMNGDENYFKEFYGASVSEMKERYREDQRQKILAERMQGQLIEEVKITPKEVTDFFNSIPKDSIPYLNAEVELGEIVFEPTVNSDEKLLAMNKAKELKERIAKGEDFSTLAKTYSQDVESAKRGGDLGFAKRGVYVPEFEATAFSLAENEISDLVETEFGYHILQFMERRGNAVRVKHILISPKITSKDEKLAKSKLDTIRNEILNDSIKFEEAVRKYSLKSAPSYSNGGRMKNPSNGTNYFETKELDPDTYFAIDNVKVGGLSEVLEIKSPRGKTIYRLVKLISKSTPHRANLKQDYDKIMYYAKESKKAKYFSEWIQEKMDKTYITVDPVMSSCPNVERWVTKN